MPTDTVPAATSLCTAHPALGGSPLGIDFGPMRSLPRDGVVRTGYDPNGNTALVWFACDLGIVMQDRPGNYMWFK
jgi:hypothetical protein